MTSSEPGSSRANECFNKALDLLSRRAHFRRELAHKLAKRGFESDEIEAALDRASEQNLLNDRECARDFARVRIERRQEGPAKLYANLTRRGADSETAREVVTECFSAGESEWLGKAASKWLGRNDWDRDRLARHLSRKGFSAAAILEGMKSFERAANREGFDGLEAGP